MMKFHFDHIDAKLKEIVFRNKTRLNYIQSKTASFTYSLAIPWQFLGNSLAIPWQFLGNSLVSFSVFSLTEKNVLQEIFHSYFNTTKKNMQILQFSNHKRAQAQSQNLMPIVMLCS